MNNGEVTVVSIPDSLGHRRIAVGGLYLGNLSNYQGATIKGSLSILGASSYTLAIVGTTAPFTFTLVGNDYTATISSGATPGTFQWNVNVVISAVVVATIVVTGSVIDLSATNIEDLVPISPKGGILDLLLVGQYDFI